MPQFHPRALLGWGFPEMTLLLVTVLFLPPLKTPFWTQQDPGCQRPPSELVLPLKAHRQIIPTPGTTCYCREKLGGNGNGHSLARNPCSQGHCLAKIIVSKVIASAKALLPRSFFSKVMPLQRHSSPSSFIPKAIVSPGPFTFKAIASQRSFFSKVIPSPKSWPPLGHSRQ